MNIYETTFIVNPQSDDSTIDRQVSAVRALITENGGKILRENRMGTRRLAYMIQGLAQGYYASYIFEAPTSALPLLERQYKLEEPYIRYLTIRFDGPLPDEEEKPFLEESAREPAPAVAPLASGRDDIEPDAAVEPLEAEDETLTATEEELKPAESDRSEVVSVEEEGTIDHTERTEPVADTPVDKEPAPTDSGDEEIL